MQAQVELSRAATLTDIKVAPSLLLAVILRAIVLTVWTSDPLSHCALSPTRVTCYNAPSTLEPVQTLTLEPVQILTLELVQILTLEPVQILAKSKLNLASISEALTYSLTGCEGYMCTRVCLFIIGRDLRISYPSVLAIHLY